MKRLKKIMAMILCVLMLAQSMAAGSSVFAASEEETSVTPQAETRIVSFDLQDGSPVQSFEYRSEDYFDFAAILYSTHHWGKSFVGCSRTPNSTNVDYKDLPSITHLPDEVTTLYGVWSDAQEVALNEKITAENPMTLRFTPPADGTYSVMISNRSAFSSTPAYCATPDDYVNCLFIESSDHGTECAFELKGNMTYEFCIDRVYYNPKTDITIEETAPFHSINYVANIGGETTMDTQYGRNVYIGKGYSSDLLIENKINFFGWSYSEGAKKADVALGDTLTLTKDTTLYAVVEPWKALEDNTVTLTNTYRWSSYYFEFTPEKSGRYSMGISELTKDNYSISCEEIGSGADGLYALLAGETYTFSVRYYAHLSGTITIAAEREDDYAYNLNFCIDYVGYDRAFSFDIDCTDSIRLPLIAPPSFINKGFLGWQDTSRDDGRIYKPGEKIQLDKDTTLVTVWKTVYPEPEGNQPLTYSQAIHNMFMVPRMFLFLFTLGVSEIRQLSKIAIWAK